VKLLGQKNEEHDNLLRLNRDILLERIYLTCLADVSFFPFNAISHLFSYPSMTTF